MKMAGILQDGPLRKMLRGRRGQEESYGHTEEEAWMMLKADLKKAALTDEPQAEVFYRKLAGIAYNIGERGVGDKLLEIANEEQTHRNEINALLTGFESRTIRF